MDEKLERALLSMISEISNYFGNQAILKGGMSLRLLGIPRSTIDVDFVFQPYKSRNEIKKPLMKFLEKICDEKPVGQIDSRTFQIRCRYQEIDILIESSVSEKIAFETISTGDVALSLGIEPCIIPIVAGPIAFSNKLGAWFERRLTRDLYDIYIYRSVLEIEPDERVLIDRIQNPSFTKKVKSKPKLKSINEFISFLQEAVREISPQQIEEDLEGIVDKLYLPGLGHKIKVTIKMMS